MDRSIHSGGRQTRIELSVTGMTIRGRRFAPEELDRIREIAHSSSGAHRFAISKRVCEALDWRQPNGRLKDRACRDVLARLHEIGFLELPGLRRPPVRRRPVPITDESAPRLASSFGPRDIDLTSFSIVTGSGDARREQLWNEYVERYHYLGYGVPLGAHLKYIVSVEQEPVACLAFSGAAWRVSARERWIGWTDEQRRRNLHLVVNNTRFLIFPWIEVPNLASRLLSLAAMRLRDDWQDRYAYRPLLLETFVPTDRYPGTCYRAANWIPIGHTRGRGRMDRRFEAAVPPKVMFLYPLVRDVHEQLRAR